MKKMRDFIPFEKLSKKNQKEQLKKHRKPPIAPSRKSDSKATVLKKKNRIEKQSLKNITY
jgi:hypothetical protein